MKILQINIFGNLSTGRIAVDLYRTLRDNGEEGKVAFARNTIAEDVPYIKIGSELDVRIHGIMTRITDRTGFYSTKATRQLIKDIESYKPDLIHLHNIHGYYLNIEVLFNYLKKTQIPVIWTLHDCWAYTGHCCYYSMAQCNKWKTGCEKCPQKKSYPASLVIDNSRWNYQRKKELFTGVNMTLVTVSKWLEEETRLSFLMDYPIQTIYNGIDLNVFKPTESSFRSKYGLEKKKIVLGVASTWDVRKGLSDFVKLSTMLDSSKYAIVVVGVNEKEKQELPSEILGICRTDSVQELAEIYTAADVFFNASVEETFGLPTIEAMACGTPAIVYNATALPEIVTDKCGVVIAPHDLRAVVSAVQNIDKRSMSQACIRNAQNYEKNKQYTAYLNLYKEILKR